GAFGRTEQSERGERAEKFTRHDHTDHAERPAFQKKERIERAADVGMRTFRIEVGHAHGVKPGNIVGAIANEAG
ncbi:MAG TPA: ATP-dependent RNA helicase, partial [Oxalobacteraceae bacterium]|nr:ATP-dependent RNA helicase [Oxalobacteraceae bacterium]